MTYRYPPCNIDQFNALEGKGRKPLIVSFAQFRLFIISYLYYLISMNSFFLLYIDKKRIMNYNLKSLKK